MQDWLGEKTQNEDTNQNEKDRNERLLIDFFFYIFCRLTSNMYIYQVLFSFFKHFFIVIYSWLSCQ